MNTLAAYRALIGNRNLLRFFTGEFISGIGDWLYLVALLVIVYRETNDPLMLGIVGGARIIPYIVLSVPAGVIVDRFDRRLILIVTDLIRAAAMVGMALVAWMDGPVLLIIGLAIFATCFAVFFRPSLGAYLPSLVKDEAQLGPANSAFATLGELSFIVGPAIGGIIIAATDLALAFAINAVTFIVADIVLWSLPANRPGARAAAPAEAGPSAPVATDEETVTAASLAAQAAPPASPVTFRTILRPLAGLAALNAVAGFLWGGVSVITVIIAVDQLGAGEAATGYLNAAIGVGGVFGALASGAIVLRPNMAPALFAGAAILGVGFFLLGIAGSLLVGIIAMAITAAGAIVAEVVGTTVFQRVVPDAIRGRTLGAMQTVETVTYASGAFLMPLLVVNVGAAIVLPVGGAAIVATSLVTLALVGPNLRRAPDAASELLLRVSRLPLFTGVPPDALERAAGRLQALAVTAGTSVIREGDPADRFYLIESGKFAVDQLDPGTRLPRRLRVMGPDEIFGELGLMNNAPRSASVITETDGRLLWLDGPDFLELLNTGPEISGRMLDRYRASAAPPS